MMMRAGYIAALTLFATAAAAQERIEIRSGEHARFSRLVFPAPPETTWTLQRENTARPAIWFENLEGEFDLSSVFEFIPRDRIADLRAGGGVLEFELGCECRLGITSLPSGHVVIDVADPGTSPAAAEDPTESRAADLDLRLPLKLDPLPVRPVPLEPRLSNTTEPARPGPLRSAASTPQAILHHVRPTLLLPDAPEEPLKEVAPACLEEDRIDALLRRDPDAVLERLDDHLRDSFDAMDETSPADAVALAEAYTSLGWGEEALHVLALLDSQAGTLSKIAAAFSDDPGARIDPACGPASTLLSLMTGAPVDWRVVNGDALSRLIGDLPALRWEVDGPAILDRFKADGRSDLALTRPAPRRVLDEGSDPRRAAGTDAAAITAALDDLRETLARDAPPDLLTIENAMALRDTVDAPARVAFDAALAEALVAARYIGNAADLAIRGAADPEQLLSVGLTRLDDGEAVELAARLRDAVTPGSAAAQRAADLLERYGLTGLARGFRGGATDRTVRPRASGAGDGADTLESRWLQRDLTAMAQGESGGEADPRVRVADLIVRRNEGRADPAEAEAASDPDYRRAVRARDDSRALADALTTLLTAAPETGR